MELRERCRSLSINPGPGEYVVGETVLYLMGFVPLSHVSQVHLCTCDISTSMRTVRGIIKDPETYLTNEAIIFQDYGFERLLYLRAYPNVMTIIDEWDFAFDASETQFYISDRGHAFLDEARRQGRYISQHVSFDDRRYRPKIRDVVFQR